MTARVIDGRYRLQERLASGGMGEVWRGSDELLARPVAVKLLHDAYAGDELFRHRLRNEARAAGGINHPNVAAVFDYGEAAGPAGRPLAYLVMELVDGEPLSALLRRQGPRPAPWAMDLVAQAAQGLAAAHAQGVVHRDIKPANLLVRRDGVVKVTDFGVARAAGAVAVTQPGAMVGTAHYMSPEQAESQPVGPESDLYSLGVVAFECLTGVRPFTGDGPAAVALAHIRRPPPPLPPDVPAPAAALVAGLLAKVPSARPGPAGSLAAAAHAAAGRPEGRARTDGLAGGTADPPASGEGRARRHRTTGRRSAWPRRGAAAAGVGAAAALVPAAWAAAGPGATTLPAVTGRTWQQARAAVTRAGLRPVIRHADVVAAAAGVVTAQSHTGGDVVDRGSTVVLTVASGWESVDLSRLVGLPAEAAAAELRLLGLRVAVSPTVSSRAAGTVVTASPGQRVRVGSVVHLLLAVPPPPPPPAVPAPTRASTPVTAATRSAGHPSTDTARPRTAPGPAPSSPPTWAGQDHYSGWWGQDGHDHHYSGYQQGWGG